MSTIINATTTNGVVIQPDNSGSLQLATNSGTTALTIDTSQNVGIGTTSPVGKLSVSLGSATSSGAPAAWDSTYAVFGSSGGTTGTAVGIGYGTGGGYILALSPAVAWQAMNYRASEHIFYTADTEQARITTAGLLQFNSGYGSVATAYGCRAWVNFNGTGTVAIRASGNVSSITDGGAGIYTVNFTTAMPDANYSTVGTCQFTLTGDRNVVVSAPYNTAPTTSAIRICTTGGTTASLIDMLYVNVSVFR
jgi:hypothetical protein